MKTMTTNEMADNEIAQTSDRSPRGRVCRRSAGGRRRTGWWSSVAAAARSRLGTGVLAAAAAGLAIECWFSWSSSSPAALQAAEKEILSYLKTPYTGRFVDIGNVFGTSDKIWTISLNEKSDKTPLLLLHGFASGVALWCFNLDALAATRPVYAIDILGFGRSSRPSFSSDALEAEAELVKSVEEWRKNIGLEKFILLGHSMGGFLAASYALRHPERVQHLILADPWGFTERPPDINERYNISLWMRPLMHIMKHFNPLSPMRLAGPFGQRLVERMRPSLIQKFSHVVDNLSVIPEYIYQCNAQSPSGEAAFHSMVSNLAWAKHPMLNRIDKLDKNIPMTLLYGSISWVDNAPGDVMREMRGDSYVKVEIINGAGHHIYADIPEVFNALVIKACSVTA